MQRLLTIAAALAACNAAPVQQSTTSCTGTSARLPQSECAAWLQIWDHLNLGYAAKRSGLRPPRHRVTALSRLLRVGCNGGRTDPCDSPTCAICSFESDGTAHISMIDIGDRGLTGTVPAALDDLPELSYLMMAANSLSGSSSR